MCRCCGRARGGGWLRRCGVGVRTGAGAVRGRGRLRAGAGAGLRVRDAELRRGLGPELLGLGRGGGRAPYCRVATARTGPRR